MAAEVPNRKFFMREFPRLDGVVRFMGATERTLGAQLPILSFQIDDPFLTIRNRERREAHVALRWMTAVRSKKSPAYAGPFEFRIIILRSLRFSDCPTC